MQFQPPQRVFRAADETAIGLARSIEVVADGLSERYVETQIIIQCGYWQLEAGASFRVRALDEFEKSLAAMTDARRPGDIRQAVLSDGDRLCNIRVDSIRGRNDCFVLHGDLEDVNWIHTVGALDRLHDADLHGMFEVSFCGILITTLGIRRMVDDLISLWSRVGVAPPE